ncbi:hypothetical protein VTL71DRAFT_5611 [Oculimacula yallundae]|uniref:Uncharacterized protein n=1 Tax=Oculimacula yallundae TaxID=86028 RepID=A0ABR4C1K5_9HELO
MLSNLIKWALLALVTVVQADYQWRAYNEYACNHFSSYPTIPALQSPPAYGANGACYSFPNFQARRIETDRSVRATFFCEKNCLMRDKKYTVNGGTCFAAPSGCSIGSFTVD